MTPNEALSWAAQQGVKINGKDRQEIARLQAEERKRLNDIRLEQLGAEPLVQRFNRSFPILVAGLINLGDVVMTVSQTLITSLGVPSILIILLFVEQERAQRGMMMFDATAQIAQFGAWAIVLLNLALEFAIEFVEKTNGWTSPKDIKPTLRTQWQALVYYLKFWGTWTPEPTSPAKSYRSLLRMTTFTILGLSLAGSMSQVISGTTGTWNQAIGNIVTSSTLAQAFAWLGGTMFALVAVLAAQRLSAYVAMRTMVTYDNMQAPNNEWDEYQRETLDEIVAQYTIARVRQEQIKAGRLPNPTIAPSLSERNLLGYIPAITSPLSSLPSTAIPKPNENLQQPSEQD